MKIVILILTLSILAIVGRCRDLSSAVGENDESERIRVCFEEPLGCFPETEPGVQGKKFYNWRINKYWRSSREKVGTEFRWWSPGKDSSVAISNFDFHNHLKELSGYESDLETFFIIHGYQGGDDQWALDMKNALMQKQRCNVFIVDWKGGSGRTYSTAVANTWVVGAETGRFIQRMANRTGLKLSKIHLIGHSLGAHAAGLAGKWIKYRMNGLVGRITGLDPAGPDYEGVVPGERLDVGDAEFVDVIHTNSAKKLVEGLGIIKPIGHFDFYPNAGDFQRGCPTAGETGENFGMGLLKMTFRIVTFQKGDEKDLAPALEGPACSHHRAIDLFIESITSPCRFMSYECDSWKEYEHGKCPPGGLTVPMGFDAKEFRNDADSNVHKKFYLRTTDGPSFCMGKV